MQSALVALSVGLIEEYSKHWVVKKTDERIFESIDDVIEYSIVAALGFAFCENIGYFMITLQGDTPDQLMSLFVVRGVFVVFVHILCSGIYGYFYGLGYFASPILKEKEARGDLTLIPNILHKLVHWKKSTIFRDEMATFGLIAAMTLHGFYDFVIELDTLGRMASLTTGNNIQFFGSDFQLHLIFLPLMLVVGYSYLSHLLLKKEHQKCYGHHETCDLYVVKTASGEKTNFVEQREQN
jgi:hypothetical protein